jgi:hypothetical protein
MAAYRALIAFPVSLAITQYSGWGGECRLLMQALFVSWYNFARKYETLKGQTPAMASGQTDHVWTIKELIERAAEC